MDVPGALGSGVEGVGAQDLAEGGDNQGVVRGDLGRNLAYAGGLGQGQVLGTGQGRDWGCAGFAPPPPAA